MSSSAPAEGSRAGGAVAVLVGTLSFKLTTTIGLLQGAIPATSIVAAFLGGFLADAVIAAVLLLAAQRLPRAAFVVGVVVGLVAACQSYFALAYGGPATWHLLAYGGAVDVKLLQREAVVAVVVAVVTVVVAALLLRRFVRGVAVVAGVLVGGGIVGSVVGVDTTLGLSRSPIMALLPARTRHVVVDGRAGRERVDGVRAPIVTTGVAPKHVVLFVSESTASRFVDDSTMPTLMALAADHGLRFDDHVAESPVSIKALFALMCGLPPLPEATLETTAIPRIACGSLPEALSSSGFAAGLFHGGYFAFTDKLAFFNERGFSTTIDGENTRFRDTRWHNGWGVDDRAIVDEALAFLDARSDPRAPSFVVVVPLIPHHEYFLPPDAATPFGDASLLSRYKNGLRFADDNLRRLVDGYKQRGLYDDSLFVVVGDHGEAFDEHPHNRLHGGFVFEENLRAPLVLHSPRALPAGAQRSRRASSHADVAATILDLVDVDQPTRTPALQAIAGQSLVADGYVPKATAHFTSYPDRRVAWRAWPFKQIVDDDRAVAFDLDADPRERIALPADDTVTRRLEQVLAQTATALTTAPRLDDGYLDRAAKAASLAVRDTRVFNMVRRCIPFRADATNAVVVTLPTLSPPATSIGIGIDDPSRMRKLGAIEATINTADENVVVVVDSVFETSSRVLRVPPQSSLTVTIAPSAKRPAGCLWVTP
ncbi:MAG TPA: sulfatase-like hydrolase/transferase [Myxococcota bacterium]